MENAIYPKNGQQIGMTSFWEERCVAHFLKCSNKGQVEVLENEKSEFFCPKVGWNKAPISGQERVVNWNKNDY